MFVSHFFPPTSLSQASVLNVLGNGSEKRRKFDLRVPRGFCTMLRAIYMCCHMSRPIYTSTWVAPRHIAHLTGLRFGRGIMMAWNHTADTALVARILNGQNMLHLTGMVPLTGSRETLSTQVLVKKWMRWPYVCLLFKSSNVNLPLEYKGCPQRLSSK